jgi:rare lipoprotein A (peptidoglycan hydrolase)
MAQSRRRRDLTAVVALACSAALTGGCGKSLSTATVPATRSGEAVDPTTVSQPAEASTPTTSKTAPTASSTTAPRPRAPARQPSRVVPPTHPVPPAHPVPATFRPAPGAPSDAEVLSELRQLSAIQRREYQQRLSAAAANLAGLLPWALEPKSGIQVSVASVFTDYGLGLACGGVLGREQLGVAHKTAPCGTLITFTYAGRSLTVPVIDRGPYVAGREWDLTGATAAALGFPGLGRIEWALAR